MRARRCWICRRTLGWNDHDWTRVATPDGSVHDVCDPCMEKADTDEYLDETLDMTEDDFNVEGQPEFNGSFR